MSEQKDMLNSLSLMGLASIKQDTSTHHTNQQETNKLIDELSAQNLKISDKLGKVDNSIQQLNIAVTNLLNSQIQLNQKIDFLSENTSIKFERLSEQTNQRFDKLVEQLDRVNSKFDKLWKERWLYRVLPLTLLGIVLLGFWQVISNWDSISSFFNAMNAFFMKN